MFAVTKPIEGSLFPKSHPWFGNSFLIFTQTQEYLSSVVFFHLTGTGQGNGGLPRQSSLNGGLRAAGNHPCILTGGGNV